MKPFYKTLVLVLVTAAAAAAAFLVDPIPQDPAYHRFTDTRAYFGIPNFWNVASNLPFLVAGALGLLQSRRLASPDLATHYRVFCAAVALVALGSAWYHFAPDNARLVLDRMPMTIAFMTLLAAVIADRIELGRPAGHGDLRAYALVQFLPMLLLPLMLLLWKGEGIAARWLWMALVAYAVAKLAEFGGLHTVKHLLAALAAWMIIRAFQRSPASAL